VAEAHVKLSSAINEDGVLDEKTRSLNLVGIYSTTRDTIALRHFTRMAFNAGASKRRYRWPRCWRPIRGSRRRS
jgi:alkylhydroperoxidase/carboxymuconolactone decarboxylase family protein YurZ